MDKKYGKHIQSFIMSILNDIFPRVVLHITKGCITFISNVKYL